jgi:calcium/calmodulin-dependent protein kinase I
LPIPPFLTHPFENDFDIGDELGSGSFSVVKLAISKKDGKKYAAKIIDKGNDDPKKLEMVKSEGRILNAIDHPNVISLNSLYETPTTFIMVLELVTGGELFDKIVELQFYSEKDASKITRQLLSSLAHMHSRNIVHRDLKPENLILSSHEPDADIKLADFGLAEFIPGGVPSLTSAVGTPGYISPEILLTLEGGPPYGPSTDMWSTGIILYILLCGFPPFYEEDEEDLYDAIIEGNFSYPDPYWTQVSDSAKDLISKMLVVDPKVRITAEQALEHPWVKGETAKSDHMDTAQIELRKFRARQRLKGAIHAVRAMKKLGGIAAALKKKEAKA